MFPWGTKSPLVEKCSCRNIQPKSAICKTSHFENLPKRMFLHWHISISILNLWLKKTASGGPASRELQQRPAPNSQQHIKRHSPTAQQIHLNGSPCQAGLTFAWVSELNTFTRKHKKNNPEYHRLPGFSSSESNTLKIN